MFGAILSPFVGLGTALVYYLKYRDAPEPKRHPSILLYVISVLGIAVLAFAIGSLAGISVACRSAGAGNLCGLWGLLISGPLLATAAMMTFARLWMKNATRPPR